MCRAEIRQFVDTYKGCYTCKSKVTPTSDKIGKYLTNATIKQRQNLKLSMMLHGFKVMSCFSPIIEQISQSDDVTIETFQRNTPQQEQLQRFR